MVSHKQQKSKSQEEERTLRRKTIRGKSLSAAQLEAGTEKKKGTQGPVPKSQSQECQLYQTQEPLSKHHQITRKDLD